MFIELTAQELKKEEEEFAKRAKRALVFLLDLATRHGSVEQLMASLESGDLPEDDSYGVLSAGFLLFFQFGYSLPDGKRHLKQGVSHSALAA